MSTRSGIARRKGDGFEGVYHHWDGYPTALGETLWKVYREQFCSDLSRMLTTLIDEHPAGWSTINDSDFGATPGFRCDGGSWEGRSDAGPECYCHGDHSEEANLINQDSDQGMEWAYVFDEEANTMAVLERIRVGPGAEEGGFEGDHATGLVGTLGANKDTGQREDAWAIRWVGKLEGEEPDWERIECGFGLEHCHHVEGFHKTAV